MLTLNKISQMEWTNLIVSDKNVLLGKPTIKNTRISVEHIITLFAQGWTEETILSNYPNLTHQHIQAVFSFIQDCMKDGLFMSNTEVVHS